MSSNSFCECVSRRLGIARVRPMHWALAALFGSLVLQACSKGITPAAEAPTATVPVSAEQESNEPEAAPTPVSQLPACQGDEFEIDILNAVAALPDDTLDAQREQLRDWVWTTTLGRLAKQSSVANVFAGVVDQPLFRDDALAHALRLPTGPTRTATTKSEEMLVLVDASSGASLRANVLDAIDEESLALGHMPSKAQVYAFEIEPNVGMVRVCQIETLDADALRTASNGYARATVTNVAQLDEFLAPGIDLLSAQCSSAGLELTGRQRARTQAAHVTSEHVAALAQKLNEHYIPPARFGKSFAALDPSRQMVFARAAAEFDSVVASPGAYVLDDRTRQLLRWQTENPGVGARDLLYSSVLQTQFDGKPGFSLDPAYQVSDVLRAYDQVLAALPDSPALVKLLRSWGRTEQELRPYRDRATELSSARDELISLRTQLAASSNDSIASLLFTVSSNTREPVAGALLEDVRIQAGQQCARYDGPLAGTEAGMTFFYTDLSAKFFARDFGRGSPEGVVPGFESVVNHVGSTAACDEPRRPNTRIWFGLRDEGYSREKDGSLRFGPTVTRLFAKGSLTGSGEEQETEPNADYRRFIGWWDRHYRAMSQWDPQYETLNQVMKWSVVAQQARAIHRDGCLDFLKSASLRTDQRLSGWVASRPQLRWANAISQFKESANGAECIPLVRSELFRSCGGVSQLSGGVTAGSLEEVSNKLIRKTATPPWAERLALGAQPTEVSAERVAFAKVERSSGGKLTAVEITGKGPKLAFKAEVDTKAGQVGSVTLNDSRWPLKRFEKSVDATGGTLRVAQRANHLLTGGLTVFDLDLAKVHVEVSATATQRAKSIGQKLAAKVAHDGGTLEDAAATLPGRHEVLALGDDSVAFRFNDADQSPVYAVMTSGPGARGPPPKGPPTDVAFFVGPLDGGRMSAGGANDSGWPLLVRMISAPEAEHFFHDAGAKLTARNPEFLALHRSFTGELEAGQIEKAKALVSAAAPTLRGDELASLEQAVTKARARASRSNANATQADQLADLGGKLAIMSRRRAAPAVGEQEALKRATRSVTPTNFPADAALPPMIRPRGKPPAPGQEYVTQLVDFDFGQLRTITTPDGDQFRVRRRQPQGRPSGEKVGSGFRLLYAPSPTALVVRCSDDPAERDKKPRCTELAPAQEQIDAVIELTLACSGAGKPCLDEALACDTDHDRAFSSAAEKECLEAVRKKYTRPRPNDPKP